jgi:hypothetical protein
MHLDQLLEPYDLANQDLEDKGSVGWQLEES